MVEKTENYAEKLEQYGITPACGWGDGLDREVSTKPKSENYNPLKKNITVGWGESD